jgi:hypothetical protein
MCNTTQHHYNTYTTIVYTYTCEIQTHITTILHYTILYTTIQYIHTNTIHNNIHWIYEYIEVK